MVRNLILVRHAKSDWSVPGLKDFDRELNARGSNDAPRMGRKLYEMDVRPDLIISSPAMRAKQTAEFIAEQIRHDFDKILFNPDVYEASVRSLLSIINDIPDEHQKVMIIGHNPTFTYIAEYLTKKPFDNIPTCGMVDIEFSFSSWKEVSGDTGNLKWFIYPKSVLD